MKSSLLIRSCLLLGIHGFVGSVVWAHPDHGGDLTADAPPAFFLVATAAEPAPAKVNNQVTITTEGEFRLIKSNGWPDHAPGEFPRRGNPNTPTEQSYNFRMALHPKAAEAPVRGGGWWWGVALNGVPFEPGTGETWNNDMQSGWRYEAATGFLNLGLDEHNAHVQPNGSYHYHALPVGLVEKLGGDGKQMRLIGWAADGYPLYTSYAYATPNDAKSELKKMKSSYRLKAGARPAQEGGPGGNYDGRFTQDFEFVKGLGELDETNGRTGVTPEFPEGTYYYCITAEFPFVPRQWHGTPDPSFNKGERGPGGQQRPAPLGGAPRGILEGGPGPGAQPSPAPGTPPGPGGPRPTMPVIGALDLNKDGVIDAEEIAKALESLKTLDKDGDGKLTPEEYRPSGFPGGPPNAGPPTTAPTPPSPPTPPAAPASAQIKANDTSPPALFNPKALVKPITEIQGILSDGSKATVYKIVVRSLAIDHEMGPWAPKTIKDKGGYWEDTVDKKLYRVDGDYLAMLNKRGWNMFDADGTVHRTKDRTEFDKVARQELAGWTFDQAKQDGVTNSVIELPPLEQIVTIFLPKNPQASAQPTMLRQAKFSPRSGVGIGTDGIRFFPPEPVNRITAFQNIAPLDPFGGHTGFGHEYHYHRAPAVMSDDKSGAVVGWALDGFPVRGPHDPNGKAPEKLDAINGHDHDGLGYHYHAINVFPYIVGGFHGPLGTAALGDVDVCDATQQSGGGGPPGRGGAGGGQGGGPPGRGQGRGTGGPAGGERPAGAPPGAGGPPEKPSGLPPSAANLPLGKPNILVLVADDLGYGDVGFHKGSVPTPNLDRFAKEGVELARFYVYPVCSPTRAALLSGQMPRRFGVTAVMGPQQALPKDLVTLPGTLRTAGYTTSLIGKWHLGKGTSTPQQYGFDHFYGFLGPEIDYFKHTDQRGAVDWQRDGTTLNESGYSTFLIADEAIKQIEQRDPKKPFYIQVSFNAVHVPQSAPEEVLAKYKNLGNQATGAAVIDTMDSSIGRILAALEKDKLKDNTLVVFFSDNGASRRLGSNGSFRAGKDTLYEGGIHTACVLRWPGQLTAGTVTQQPTAVQDLFPTLTAAAGVATPAKLDGINLWTALRSGRVEARAPFAIATADIALIDGDWKLIETNAGQRSLYNLKSDPSENKDELATQPEQAQRLTASLTKLKADLPAANARGGGRPGPGPGPGPGGGGGVPLPRSSAQPAREGNPDAGAIQMLEFQSLGIAVRQRAKKLAISVPGRGHRN